MIWLLVVIALFAMWQGQRLMAHPKVLLPAGLETQHSLSIVIPARNEEHRIGALLQSLRDELSANANLAARTQVIVVDDHSTDQTAQLVLASGFEVLPATELPPGWTGKCWALELGARHAAGEIILFLDADVWFKRGALPAMLAQRQSLAAPAALSVLPYHELHRPYENLSALFHLLMVMGTGACASPRLKKQNATKLVGPSLMLERKEWLRVAGFNSVRGEVLENLHLTEVLHHAGVNTMTILGGEWLRTRMYPEGIGALWRGWTKAFADGSRTVARPILRATIWWMTSGFLAWILCLIHWSTWLGWLPYALFAVLFYRQLRLLGKYSLGAAIFYPLSLIFYLAAFAASWWRGSQGRAQWKGRAV